MEISIPTELKQALQNNRAAKAIYSKMSDQAKRYYAAYVIAAATVKDRKCRAKHSLKMLLGQEQKITSAC